MAYKFDDDGFDDMLRHAILSCDKEAMEMMDRVGKIVLKYSRRMSKVQVDERTGNYLRSWKDDKARFSRRGEIYKLWGNKSPHAHLVEDGHRNVDANGKEHGFTPGYQVLKHAQEEAQSDIESEIEGFVNRVLGGG